MLLFKSIGVSNCGTLLERQQIRVPSVSAKDDLLLRCTSQGRRKPLACGFSPTFWVGQH
jgi:hypothetical protein